MKKHKQNKKCHSTLRLFLFDQITIKNSLNEPNLIGYGTDNYLRYYLIRLIWQSVGYRVWHEISYYEET